VMLADPRRKQSPFMQPAKWFRYS